MDFKFNSTRSQLYIVELSPPFERRMIQFVPDSISVPRKANMQDTTIVGRNNEIMQYITGSETLSLNLDFYSDDDERKDVISTINWFKSLTYNDGAPGKFRNVRIVFGDLFKNDVWVLTGVDPDFSIFDSEKGWLPVMAKVKLDFKLDPKKNLTLNDIRSK